MKNQLFIKRIRYILGVYKSKNIKKIFGISLNIIMILVFTLFLKVPFLLFAELSYNYFYYNNIIFAKILLIAFDVLYYLVSIYFIRESVIKVFNE